MPGIRTIPDVLAHALEAFPEREAVVDGDMPGGSAAVPAQMPSGSDRSC
jgi:hypothetical protein